MEMWQYHIVNLLMRVRNCSPSDAYSVWHSARLRKDPVVDRIIADLVEKTPGGCWILLNRNPTINVGSILFMRVARVKDDPGDFTTSVPNGVLSLLAGDYDGDTLNLIPVFEAEETRAFQSLNPRRMMVSRNDGRFERQLNLERDQVVGLAQYIE
jgi:hypothetical protein